MSSLYIPEIRQSEYLPIGLSLASTSINIDTTNFQQDVLGKEEKRVDDRQKNKVDQARTIMNMNILPIIR